MCHSEKMMTDMRAPNEGVARAARATPSFGTRISILSTLEGVVSATSLFGTLTSYHSASFGWPNLGMAHLLFQGFVPVRIVSRAKRAPNEGVARATPSFDALVLILLPNGDVG